MNKSNTHFKFTILLTILFSCAFAGLSAQQTKIPGTNLKLELKDGFKLDKNAASISNSQYSIVFIEMQGINFYDQIEDFDDIESQYAEKGISVKKNVKGKVNNYDAQLITLDSEPFVFQVFFGDDTFCAIANATGIDATIALEEIRVKELLGTIEYEKSTLSALDEHALFKFTNESEDWKFVSYQVNNFAFENVKTDDVILLMQLPLETLVLHTKESLAQEMATKLEGKIPTLKTIKEGPFSINKLDGHRLLLDVGKEGNSHLELIYVYVFKSTKSTFMFQGMGAKNDRATKKMLESFLENIELID